MQKKIDTSKAPGALGPYSQAVEIDNLITFIQYQLYFLPMLPHPSLNLLLIFHNRIQSQEDKISRPDCLKVFQSPHKSMGKAVRGQEQHPVIPDRNR